MFKKLYELPSVPGDEEKNYHLRLIVITTDILLVALPLALVVNLLDSPLRLPLIIGDLVEFLGTLIIRQWTLRYQRTTAGVYLVVVGFLTATLMSAYLGTNRTSAMILFVVWTIQASLLFGRKGLVISILTVALSMGGVMAAESQGLLQPPNASVMATEWTKIVIFTILGAGMAFSSQRIAHRALDKAKKEFEERQRTESALAVTRERERMGRDLHDSLGQVLSFIVVQSQATAMLVKEGQLKEAEANLDQLEQAAGSAAVDLRQHILGLRSSRPDQNFVDLLDAMIAQYKERYSLQVNLSLPDEVGVLSLTADAQEPLLFVIQETLTNTAKHAQASLVMITFSCLHDSIQVFISDNGMGFDPSKSMGKDHFGLQIMRERMEQIRGTFEIRSKPGSGTQVLLSLPRSPRSETQRQALKALRILLADDHPLFMEGLQKLLVGRGMNVIATARDGQEAVEKAFALHPDVLIMDMNMPRLTGLAATRQIKEKLPEIKIIILTISDDEEILYQALQNGASGYLLKTLDADKLSGLLYELTQGETPLAPGLAGRLVNLLARSSDEALVGEDLYGLSAQQLSILRLVKKGKTYKEIGVLMQLSEPTIKYHMAQILKRLNLSTREEALHYLDEQTARKRM
jgi:signal transduction histidine kinase/DNA-binding NarL/FixJ family response regulator